MRSVIELELCLNVHQFSCRSHMGSVKMVGLEKPKVIPSGSWTDYFCRFYCLKIGEYTLAISVLGILMMEGVIGY